MMQNTISILNTYRCHLHCHFPGKPWIFNL